MYYSQLDNRWANDTIADTRLKIGRWGCTICSICTLIHKYGGKTTPKEAAKKWKFTTDGRVYWNNNFEVIKFVGRFNYDEKKLKEWLKNKNNCAVIEVRDFHWLAVEGFRLLNLGMRAIDPLGGIVCNPVKKYKRLTRMVFLTKK